MPVRCSTGSYWVSRASQIVGWLLSMLVRSVSWVTGGCSSDCGLYVTPDDENVIVDLSVYLQFSTQVLYCLHRCFESGAPVCFVKCVRVGRRGMYSMYLSVDKTGTF